MVPPPCGHIEGEREVDSMQGGGCALVERAGKAALGMRRKRQSGRASTGLWVWVRIGQ